MTTVPTPDDIADLSEADVAALQLALDLTLADDPPDGADRVEQAQWKLEHDGWRETAEFCAYHQQMRRLDLHPAQSPPCWLTTAEADAILAEGPISAMDGSDFDISDCRSARLLRRMVRHGVSPYHPDPVRAVRDAQRAKGAAR